MGSCCNPRTMSYVSAGIQIALWILAGICGILIIVAVNSDKFYTTGPRHTLEDANFLAKLGIHVGGAILFFTFVNLALLTVLIIGVKKNHLTMVSIYVYTTMVFIGLQILYVLYNFIMGFVNGYPVGAVFLGLFLNALCVGVGVLMFWPMYLFHKQLRSPHFQPEHHDLRSNQPIHKPQYAA